MPTSIYLAPLSGRRTPTDAYRRVHLEPYARIEAEIVVALEGGDEDSPAQSTDSPRVSRSVSTRSRAGSVGATGWVSGDCAPARRSTIPSCSRNTQSCKESTCDAAVELAVLCEDKELHGKERPTAPTIQRSEVTMRVPQPSWQPLFTQRHHRVEGVDVPAACAWRHGPRRPSFQCRLFGGFPLYRERSY